jgi:lysophospholipase L1-like esterase
MDVVTLGQAKLDAKKRYLPGSKNKLLGFHVALANRASSPCDILVIADSVGEGVGVNTGTLTNRWINQLAIALRQHYPVAGVAGGFGYRAAWTGAGVSAPATSGTVTQSTRGLGHRSLILGAGATVTFTEVCTSFQVRLYRSTTDALTVSVDGSSTTVTAGPSGDFTYTSAALTRATHTIVVTQTAGSPEVEGLMVFDGDELTGVRMWDNTKAGTQASAWTTAGGGSEAWVSAATGFTPSLVVIGSMLNDAPNVSATTYKTNVNSLVAKARATWANVPILLVGSYQPPSRQTGNVDAWAAYGAALQAVADGDAAIAYCDLGYRIGSIATDTYGLLNDTTHPNNKGHRVIAQAVFDFIRPGSRDVDVARLGAVTADSLWLDTAVSGTPATPSRGAVIYGESANNAALVLLPTGDIINELGKTIAISSSQNPWRLAWRYGRITTGASTLTMTLPASGVAGQRYTFKKVDAGAGTVVIACPTPGGNTQTIEGATTKTLTGQWSYITVQSTGLANAAGVGWEITGQGGTIS